MDSIWFLLGCAGFFWVVVWSLRDFTKPGKLFWPFDARWMPPPPDPGPRRWRRAEPQRGHK